MLWYKSWLETRWRFLVGLGLLLCAAAAAVLTYPQVLKLLPQVPANVDGVLGERIREAAELARSFRGYVWSSWFRQNLSEGATLFAVLLGTASLLSLSGGALFTLSLPVSRRRLVGVRAATGLAELFVLVLIPSLLMPLLAPAIGEHYALGSALIHGLCLFIAASVFFSLALLLSTVFGDLWRPLLIALAVAFALVLVDQFLPSPAWSLYDVMSGEAYYRTGRLPWGGLLAASAVSAALHSAAVFSFDRRDF
jgi:ABC-2 type transport system permease protein